ncbi:MAG: hypothetical protein ABUS56_08030 [Acidobacteriota bacterium]
MINYTDHLTMLMKDIVSRVPVLSFIDTRDVLVFARFGRSHAEGAFATCHCLNLPPSEPGHYFWRDRASGRITRRSEWFVTRSPRVSVAGRSVKYLVSFALPRFCDQSLEGSRKALLYPRLEPWVAKLDTVVHELYHIDPQLGGIRRIAREDGAYLVNSHSPRFFEQVAAIVRAYLDTHPDPGITDFLRHDFAGLEARHGGVIGASFRTFPSFPQRYIERLAEQVPADTDAGDVKIEPLRPQRQPTVYTEDDLDLRHFSESRSRRLAVHEPDAAGAREESRRLNSERLRREPARAAEHPGSARTSKAR